MDNQSAIAVAKNPEHHGRMKHLDLRLLGVDSGGRPESEGSEESWSWVNGIHGRG